jgi:type I restriction-modification system DNA methylase subunit
MAKAPRKKSDSTAKLGDISIYSQETNATNRRLATMDPAMLSIEADFDPEHADTFRPTARSFSNPSPGP